MSDIGGTADAVDVDLTLDDQAGAPLPDSGPLVSGSFQPFNSATIDPVPAPAPSPNGVHTPSVFDSTTNGTVEPLRLRRPGEQRRKHRELGPDDHDRSRPSADLRPGDAHRRGHCDHVVALSVELHDFGAGASITDVNLVWTTSTTPSRTTSTCCSSAPQGQNAIVTSDAGGRFDVTDVDLTLDDEAGAPIPDATQITSGAYQPGNYTPADTLPAPAPAPSGGSALSVFDGTDPNGVWNLYVYDDAAPTAAISGAGTWSSRPDRHHHRHHRHRHRHLRHHPATTAASTSATSATSATTTPPPATDRLGADLGRDPDRPGPGDAVSVELRHLRSRGHGHGRQSRAERPQPHLARRHRHPARRPRRPERDRHVRRRWIHRRGRHRPRARRRCREPLPDEDRACHGHLPAGELCRAGTDAFPAPAPAPSGNVNLSVFNGTNPNGTWSLYVVDDEINDGAPSGAGA